MHTPGVGTGGTPQPRCHLQGEAGTGREGVDGEPDHLGSKNEGVRKGREYGRDEEGGLEDEQAREDGRKCVGTGSA